MNTTTTPAAPGAPGPFARFLEGDIWHSFRHSPMAILAAVIAALCVCACGDCGQRWQRASGSHAPSDAEAMRRAKLNARILRGEL
jgi:hypothetical protein